MFIYGIIKNHQKRPSPTWHPKKNCNRQRLRLEEQNLLTFFVGINFDKQRIGYSKKTETTKREHPAWVLSFS